MTSETIVPEDIKEMISEILANEAKEEKTKEDEDMERIYIDEIIPDIKDEEEQKNESWKIEISF